MPPFIVFALPRSRTAWLSRFLSYGDWCCGHDEAVHMRSMEDVKAWLSQPNTGTVETAVAPFWRTLRKLSPDCRVVVIRRPVEDVVNSLMRLGMPFNREAMTAEMRRYDRKLDQIERRIPGVLSVSFSGLEDEAVCARVFEHCLPYKHDHAWWAALSKQNVQINMRALLRYCQAYGPQMQRLVAQAKCLTLAEFAKSDLPPPDGVTLQQESFESFYRDGERMFNEHLTAVGEAPGNAPSKNIELLRVLDTIGALQVVTARCNGRMFGYLVSVIGPSLEVAGQNVGFPTLFYASPDFKGLGRHLQHASVEALRKRGVHEVVFRAGVRGDGPRLGALYRRMGAEDHGQLFRLNLKE